MQMGFNLAFKGLKAYGPQFLKNVKGANKPSM
jgi:hypothetical protein